MQHMHSSRAHTKDMSQGNIYSLIIGFALPIFLSQVFQQLYNTADALVVGKFLGTEALAAVLLAEVIGVFVYRFAPQLIGLFDQTPKVIELGVLQAHTVALFYFLLAFSHSIAAVCRGAGHAFVPMVIMLAVWCVIRICYILLVMRLFGKLGYIYWAYPLTWCISSVIYLVYYLKSDWVHGFDRAAKGSLTAARH